MKKRFVWHDVPTVLADEILGAVYAAMANKRPKKGETLTVKPKQLAQEAQDVLHREYGDLYVMEHGERLAARYGAKLLDLEPLIMAKIWRTDEFTAHNIEVDDLESEFRIQNAGHVIAYIRWCNKIAPEVYALLSSACAEDFIAGYKRVVAPGSQPSFLDLI